MRNEKIILILMVAALWTGGCKNDDVSDPAPENQVPESFTINTEVDANTARLIWSRANDPEGGKVKYAIFLEGTEISDGLTDTTFTLSDLTYEQEYSGKVVAEDSVGATVEQAFSFTTGFMFLKSHEVAGSEYFLEYDEDGMLVNVENSGSATNQVLRNGNEQVIKLGASSFSYNSGGLIKSVDDGNGEGLMQYDSQDRLIKMSATYNITPTYKVRVIRDHTYNGQDQLVQVLEEVYDFYYENYTYTRIELEYDSKGNVVREESASSSDGETYGTPTVTTYTYDTSKNPWYTVLTEQTNLQPLYVESNNLLNSTLSMGNSVVYRSQWTSRNNIKSSRTEYAGDYHQREYTYTYNEEGYPLTLQVDVSSSGYEPYTYYQRWYY